jgi:hypothetical protein
MCQNIDKLPYNSEPKAFVKESLKWDEVESLVKSIE